MILFEFETKAFSEFIWFPGKLNPADVGTKFDSPLNTAVKLMLHSSIIPLDFTNAEACESNRPIG